MNEIYGKINKMTGGKYAALRFSRLALAKSGAVVTVVCKPSDGKFAAENIAELTELLTAACGLHTPISVEIDASPLDERLLRSAVVRFTEGFEYISSALHTVRAEMTPAPTVKIKMHAAMHELAEGDYIPRLKEFLSNRFADDIALDIEVVDYSDIAGGKAMTTASEYEIKDCVPLIGNFAPQKARSAASIDSAGYNVSICGVYAMPTEFTGKNGKPYERFLLVDGESAVQCKFFCSRGGTALFPEHMNKTVCVSGTVEYDAMRSEASVIVNAMSLCKAVGLNIVQPRPEPADYAVVRPTDCEELVQSSMFDMSDELPPTLLGDFVAFDFETTGLSSLYDSPTELGAVKVRNGKIIQRFSTLIDPRRPIPPEVSEKTGITDEMVKGQPLFEDVLPDFYKFSYGCAMIGHNISFDYPFLLKGGNRSGWAFSDRKTYDTMGIAPKALPGITRVSLDKVLEALGLVNDCAHRAVTDAEATARAFIEMQKILAEK